MSPRTIRHWVHDLPMESVPRPGRPPHGESARKRALFACARMLRRQGYAAGADAVFRALPKPQPLRLVRLAVKALKQRHQERRARGQLDHRVTMTVQAKDALWGLDATHLGRERGAEVQGQAVKVLGSLRIAALSSGPAVTARDALAILKAAHSTRGTLPLVLVTDNGSPYVAQEVADYLRDHRVIHLRNLPHTPQHNGCTERAMRDLKYDTGLGKGAETDPLRALIALERSRRQLDEHRLRQSIGWKTAKDYDHAMPSWYARVSRDRFYEAAQQAIETAVHGLSNARERRRAEREAILATLEDFELITRTRGGRPLPRSKPARVS